MKRAIKCVLFIDDDKATNFIHKFLAKKTSCFENVEAVSSAREGLDYLQNAEKGQNTIPDLIFLDINMPAMNGWDFLNHYEQEQFSIKERIKIYILSSSSRSTDIDKAKEYDHVCGFITKPLTENLLTKLLEKNVF